LITKQKEFSERIFELFKRAQEDEKRADEAKVAATPSKDDGKVTPHGLKEKWYFIEEPVDFNSTAVWPIRRK
jgi:hypothetical protein